MQRHMGSLATGIFSFFDGNRLKKFLPEIRVNIPLFLNGLEFLQLIGTQWGSRIVLILWVHHSQTALLIHDHPVF